MRASGKMPVTGERAGSHHSFVGVTFLLVNDVAWSTYTVLVEGKSGFWRIHCMQQEYRGNDLARMELLTTFLRAFQ